MVSEFQKITQKSKGQAMAEFALTIPVFLLLVFGIIELSRFFLVYSSVFTAVREATRYGSSVGDEGVLNYLDCSEIAETAARTGHFGGVQKELVQISYESVAPESDESRTIVASCPNNDPGTVPEITDCEDDCEYTPSLGDRVYIEIATDYVSLLGIVPNLTVDASNGRTIMMGVNQQVAVVKTEDPDDESTPVPTEDTTTPEPTEDTTTPEPTEVTTTPEPTEDPSTPEPTEDPTEDATCPVSADVAFVDGYSLSPNTKSLIITLENNSSNSYTLLKMIDITWTKEAGNNGNKTRYLQSIKSGSTDLYNLGVNIEPNLEGNVPFSNIVSVSPNDDLQITFNFSEQSDDISLSFDLEVSNSDNPTCSYTITYSVTGN